MSYDTYPGENIAWIVNLDYVGPSQHLQFDLFSTRNLTDIADGPTIEAFIKNIDPRWLDTFSLDVAGKATSTHYRAVSGTRTVGNVTEVWNLHVGLRITDASGQKFYFSARDVLIVHPTTITNVGIT